jgi:hypothetical protein
VFKAAGDDGQAAGNILDVPVAFYCVAIYNVMYRALKMVPMSVETLSAGMVRPRLCARPLVE